MSSDLSDDEGTHVPLPGENHHSPTDLVGNSPRGASPPTAQDTRFFSPPALPAPDPSEERQKEVVPDKGQEISFCPITGRVRILLTLAFHRVVKYAREALCHAHSDDRLPRVYQAGGRPVLVGDSEADGKMLQPITSPEHMKELLSESAFFFKKKVMKDGADEEVPENPPVDVCRAILADPGPLPELKGIASTPPLRKDGSICQQRGYDPETGYYFDPGGMPEFNIPERPTGEEIKCAIEVIKKPFEFFDFATLADWVNYLALLLTLLVRPILQGNVPFFVIDAPIQGSGKSKLGYCAIILATNGSEATMVAPERGGDEEMRKRITAHLLIRPLTGMIDNIVGQLSSSSLASVLTAGSWTDRILGKSEMVRMEVKTVFFCTGVNVEVAGDMSRRSVYIRLDPAVDKPWTRTFPFDPEEYVREHRFKLLTALYMLIHNWFAKGQPKWQGASFGSFESWATVVGGILDAAGIEGFLENRDVIDNAANRESAELASFYESWRKAFGNESQRAAELAGKLAAGNVRINGMGDLRANLLEDLLLVIDQNEGRASVKFGQALAKYKNRVAGGLKMVATLDSNKIMRWTVVPADQNAEAP